MSANANFVDPRTPMRSHIKLVGHFITHLPGGIRADSIGLTFDVAGHAVQVPMWFVPIGDDLAVAPYIEQDGDAALRVHLDKWMPLRLRDPGAGFPIWLHSQALAVRVCRAFDNDTATSWQDSPDRIRGWLDRWATANDL